ncbi:hypothetical protein B4135_0353 [Caldibacillus debilis]|uniref:Uncharacterized protein n=1 Tax=Caldibacillus debilis TaxID=301148 RepID=A0A150M5T0_9BACI|nr:hypothetical protein B4135_0353 [Caldibacillus debilis]
MDNQYVHHRKKLSVIPQFMVHHRPAVPTSDGKILKDGSSF